jgi:hypothetical protein
MTSSDLSPQRLKRLRWKGEQTYRVLSYYFSVRWNWAEAGEYVRHVLRGFTVPFDQLEVRNPPTPGMPARYTVVDLGRRQDRRYRLLYGDGDTPMMSSNDPGDVLKHFFWNVNSEAIRRTGDFLLIHSGSVVSPSGNAVLIPGRSGSGKSTLVAGLVRAGFGYLSDEAAAIDPVTRRLYPYPKALTLKENKAELFPELASKNGSALVKGQLHLHPEDIGPGKEAGPTDVRFVFVHRHEKGAAAAQLTPISRAKAALELGRNTMNISTYRARMLPILADVVKGARTYSLVSGDLKEAVRIVADITQ